MAPLQINQTRSFEKQTKKLHLNEKKALDSAIAKIKSCPTIGKMKIGDLSGIQVYKYKHENNQFLLAYRYLESQLVLVLISHGTHENFYRDLKETK